MIWVLQQVIDRAHAHGIKVIGCTLTPYEGAGYSRENGEAIRSAVNQWIRTSGAFDAVVDFEAATRDASNPKRFKAEFDPGDHLHPNDSGYKAMADAIDLSMFKSKNEFFGLVPKYCRKAGTDPGIVCPAMPELRLPVP